MYLHGSYAEASSLLMKEIGGSSNLSRRMKILGLLAPACKQAALSNPQ